MLFQLCFSTDIQNGQNLVNCGYNVKCFSTHSFKVHIQRCPQFTGFWPIDNSIALLRNATAGMCRHKLFARQIIWQAIASASTKASNKVSFQRERERLSSNVHLKQEALSLCRESTFKYTRRKYTLSLLYPPDPLAYYSILILTYSHLKGTISGQACKPLTFL